MRDLLLDDDGDLDITDHTVRLTPVGAASVRQRLRLRLLLWRGEWFLDQNLGVSYTRDVMVKNPALSAIDTLLRRVISTCPGVVSLDEFSLALGHDRVLRVTFKATAFDGETIAENDFEVGT